jgi:hypothetical protein
LAERIVNTLDRNDIEAIDMEREMVKLREIARIGEAISGLEHPHQSCTRPFAQLAPAALKGGRARSRARRKEPKAMKEAVVD